MHHRPFRNPPATPVKQACTPKKTDEGKNKSHRPLNSFCGNFESLKKYESGKILSKKEVKQGRRDSYLSGKHRHVTVVYLHHNVVAILWLFGATFFHKHHDAHACSFWTVWPFSTIFSSKYQHLRFARNPFVMVRHGFTVIKPSTVLPNYKLEMIHL